MELSDITALKNVTTLEFLSLQNSKVSELDALYGMDKLKDLSISGAPITQAEQDALEAELPNCDVSFYGTHPL